LIGWGEALEATKELIAKLDQPVAPETQLRVFPLRQAPAESAASTLEGFFTDQGGMGPQVQVEPDTRTNALIVRASPRDMAEVELLLEHLDRSDSEAVKRTRVHKLKHALADDVAATLEDAITAAAGGGTGAGARKSAVLELLTADVEGRRLLKSGLLDDVQITPDPHTNTLLIAAPAESIDLLIALIEELDSPTGVAQIKVFKVVNGDANSLIEMLRILLPAQAGAAGPQLAGAEGESTLVPVRFSVDARTNSIIATGSEGDLAIIEALLLRLDAEEVEERKTTVYRLKNSPAPDVAETVNEYLRSRRMVELAAPGAASPFQQIEREVIVVPEQVTNSLIISATPRFYTAIEELVKDLDEAPAQVMIQVVIAEVELNDVDEFGVELGLQDSILFDRSLLGDLVTVTETFFNDSGVKVSETETVIAATQQPGYDFNNNPLGNAGSQKSFADSGTVAGQGLSHFDLGRMSSELGYGGLVLSASSQGVSVLIRALQESRRLDVLGRPQIMTLDNQPAYIQVGKLVPRIAGTRFDANTQTNQIDLEPTGLILGVTPRVSPEGTVVMEIDAEKSDLGPEAEGIPVSYVGGQVIRQPAINMTLAQTTVSAASGETIVLGGLITKKKSTIERRVPWLSRVPVLGNLFRYDNQTEQRTELLIILTPHVITNEEDAERIKQAEAARMSWCLADVVELNGPIGVHDDRDASAWRGEGEVIYPDLNPRGLKPGEFSPEKFLPEDLPL
ncbi:MAG: secretin N-terminal domain-containing protein, partial [Planctomycetota bacterium]